MRKVIIYVILIMLITRTGYTLGARLDTWQYWVLLIAPCLIHLNAYMD